MAELPTDHPFAGPDPERRLRDALARIDTDVTPRPLAVRRLAAATRAVIDELVRTSADAEAVEEAAALVERAASLLARGPLDRPYGGAAEASLGPDAGWSGDRSFLEFSPLFGQANALAPPLMIRAEDGGTRVALGAVGPTPLRARRAEELISHERRPSESAIAEFRRLVSEEVKPITDHRSTAEYRRHAAGVLAERCLRRVLEAA